jgi:hypothetical protein
LLFGYELAAFLILVGLLALVYPQGPRATALRFGLPSTRRFAEWRYFIRYMRALGLAMVGGGVGVAIGLSALYK